jgi:hypothetical protein
MNAPAAAAKRLFIVLSAAGRENGTWGFTSANARDAPERESVLALSAEVQGPFKPRHNQTDPPPARSRTGRNQSLLRSLPASAGLFLVSRHSRFQW